MTKLFQVAVAFSTLLFSSYKTGDSSPAGCQEGNCFNGYGKYQYANGNKYVGDFAAGKPHGNGILYLTNGSKYLGAWEDSWQQGNGKYIFQEGHEYIGGFQRNKFHGKGKMQYANGDRYEGNWKSNLPNGLGAYFFVKGGKYEGGFKDGSFHGQGTMWYKDGAIFNGQWQQSKKHGPGVFTDANGVAQQAEWVNGRPINAHIPEPEDAETIHITPAADDETSIESQPVEKEEKSPSFPPTAEKSSVRIWATVVGVASYNHMPSLRYTDDDAYQVYAFLKSPEGGALPDEQLEVLVDDSATKENILTAMRNTFLRADENDVVLFYFSGHGVEGAFIPFDFDGFDNRLYHSEVREILDASKAKHKIVLGDACHAGSLYGSTLEGDVLASRHIMANMLERFYSAFENSKGGMALLMSSKGQEVSLEDSGLRSGVFSHYLIRGLKGEADYNHDDIVTIEEVYEFTNENVSSYTVGAQTPVLSGDFDKSMPVSVVRRR